MAAGYKRTMWHNTLPISANFWEASVFANVKTRQKNGRYKGRGRSSSAVSKRKPRSLSGQATTALAISYAKRKQFCTLTAIYFSRGSGSA